MYTNTDTAQLALSRVAHNIGHWIFIIFNRFSRFNPSDPSPSGSLYIELMNVHRKCPSALTSTRLLHYTAEDAATVQPVPIFTKEAHSMGVKW